MTRYVKVMNPATGVFRIMRDDGTKLTDLAAPLAAQAQRPPEPPRETPEKVHTVAHMNGSLLEHARAVGRKSWRARSQEAGQHAYARGLGGPTVEQLIDWRKELGWSQRKLAEEAGYVRSYVAMIETIGLETGTGRYYSARINLARAMGKTAADWGEG